MDKKIKMPQRDSFKTIEEWCNSLNEWVEKIKEIEENETTNTEGKLDWRKLLGITSFIQGSFRSLCNYEVTEYYNSNDKEIKKHKGVKRLEHWGSGGAVHREGYDLKEFYDENGKDVTNIVSKIDGNYYVEYPKKNNTNKINWIIIFVLIGVVFFAYRYYKK